MNSCVNREKTLLYKAKIYEVLFKCMDMEKKLNIYLDDIHLDDENQNCSIVRFEFDKHECKYEDEHYLLSLEKGNISFIFPQNFNCRNIAENTGFQIINDRLQLPVVSQENFWEWESDKIIHVFLEKLWIFITYFEKDNQRHNSIMVIGCGGAGINIVDAMIDSGIKNIDFAVVDTDMQKLNISKAPAKIAIGQNLTGGLSAGGKPDRGEQAVEENVGVIRELISGIDIVFIVAGMSGGTGTGAAHVIARIAHEKKVLVMAAVMMPFEFEGSVRKEFAKNGIEKLRKNTDSLTIIRNEQIKIVNREKTLGFIQAINFANTILCQIGQVLSELAVDSKRKKIIHYMIRNAGNTFFAVGTGTGENRIKDAVQNAVSNAMLETNGIAGARKILINIRLSGSLSDEEQNKIISLVKQYADSQVHIRFFISVSNNMYNQITVAVIATDFRK